MSKNSHCSTILFYTIISIALSIPIHAESTPHALGIITPGEKMHFTIGNDVPFQIKTVDEARKNLQERIQGDTKTIATAFEPYVKWMMLEPEKNKWDFSYYDMVVKVCEANGIKWVPFLIAGPAYATPMWFKESQESVFAKCLEHEKESRSQSIWNPAMPSYVDTLVRNFSEHFDHNQMQTLLLGISGDFGESIYNAGGNEWTYIWDGEYHVHTGWWCGDPYAQKDFQKKMRTKYNTIEALNKKWKTHYESFDDLKPFTPDKTPGRQATLDMGNWYRQSMTQYADVWFQATKKWLPDVPVILCTGGSGSVVLGADFSEQAILCSQYGYGIRITNEASNYERNFVLTRWVGSACRNLGVYFGYEPAGKVTEKGTVARMYNATVSGADELFVYVHNKPTDGSYGKIYEKHKHLMTKRTPKVDIAIFLPKTSQVLGMLNKWYEISAAFRDYSDFDFIDESLIEQDLLKNYKVIIWPDGSVTDTETLKKIKAWTEHGGKLYMLVKCENIEGQDWTECFAKNDNVKIFDPDLPYESAFEFIAKAESEIIPDGKKDEVYWTTFMDNSVMILNYSDKTYQAGELTVEPCDIAYKK